LSPFLQQNNIDVNKNLDAVEMNANTSLYIGLIINELIVNSIKHAFPNQENKQIELSVRDRNRFIEITYKDNGVGISKNTKAKLLTTLSRQIEAEYLIENNPGFYYQATVEK